MRTLVVIPLLLILAACGGSASPTSTPGATAPTATVSTPAPLPASPPGGALPTGEAWVTPSGDLPGPVRLAVGAAAEAASVPVEQVVVVAWAAVDWESSALGCPKPDMVYLPVITPGYAVRLSIGGKEVEYHTNLETTVVRCSPPLRR